MCLVSFIKQGFLLGCDLFHSLRLAAGKESGQWSDTMPANIKEFFYE
jgi:hypothetical protein